MGEPFKAGCQRPESTIFEEPVSVEKELPKEKERKKSMIQVGKPVPNFELPAYHKGEFKQFSLEEFRGKWVLLCFYPGDFTFV